MASFKNGPEGYLTIVGKAFSEDGNPEVFTRVRCRITRNGVTYTSPYFALRSEGENVPFGTLNLRSML